MYAMALEGVLGKTSGAIRHARSAELDQLKSPAQDLLDQSAIPRPRAAEKKTHPQTHKISGFGALLAGGSSGE